MSRILFALAILVGCVHEEAVLSIEQSGGLTPPDAGTSVQEKILTLSPAAFANALVLWNPMRAVSESTEMFASLPMHVGDRVTSVEVECIGSGWPAPATISILRTTSEGIDTILGTQDVLLSDPVWQAYRIPDPNARALLEDESITLRVYSPSGAVCGHVHIRHD